jgi:hypothetical protein
MFLRPFFIEVFDAGVYNKGQLDGKKIYTFFIFKLIGLIFNEDLNGTNLAIKLSPKSRNEKGQIIGLN